MSFIFVRTFLLFYTFCGERSIRLPFDHVDDSVNPKPIHARKTPLKKPYGCNLEPLARRRETLDVERYFQKEYHGLWGMCNVVEAFPAHLVRGGDDEMIFSQHNYRCEMALWRYGPKGPLCVMALWRYGPAGPSAL